MPGFKRLIDAPPEVGRSIQYPPTAEQVELVGEDGRGVLRITELKLGNLDPGEKAHIESMEFEVMPELWSGN